MEQNIEKEIGKPTWIQIVSTFILYLMQSLPFSIFGTLYPVLYGMAGFSGEELSTLRFATIPYCLKFAVGWLYQVWWIPPRWFTILCQCAMGIILGSIYFVPLKNVKTTMILYFASEIFMAFHDAAFDSLCVKLYSGSAFLFEMLQMIAVLVVSILLSFVGISFYKPYLFLICGSLTIITSPLFFLFKWNLPEIREFKGVFTEIWRKFWLSIFSILYYLFTNWGSSLLGYFTTDIILDEKEVGNAIGIYTIGQFFGIGILQYAFIKTLYKNGLIIVFVIEALGVLIFMFLKPETSINIKYTAYFFGGMLLSFTDTLPETLIIDASANSNASTFLLSWFQSILSSGYAIGDVIFPLIKDKISWNTFWLINIIMCVLGGVIVAVLRFFVPLWSNLPDLNIPPSLNTEIFGCYKESESIYEDDESERNE